MARFVGYIWGFYPGVGPIFFPDPATYLPASSEGVSYSARSEQLPPAVPAAGHWHQSGNLWSTLPKGITRAMPWSLCPPAQPDTLLATPLPLRRGHQCENHDHLDKTPAIYRQLPGTDNHLCADAYQHRLQYCIIRADGYCSGHPYPATLGTTNRVPPATLPLFAGKESAFSEFNQQGRH
jgi:hypothetical protein